MFYLKCVSNKKLGKIENPLDLISNPNVPQATVLLGSKTKTHKPFEQEENESGVLSAKAAKKAKKTEMLEKRKAKSFKL